MVKLIVSDMDGTLLNEKMMISQTNADAIREAEKQGIPFMVATGRGFTEAKPLLEEAGLSCPIITLNGAQVYDEKGTILKTAGITKDTARKILATIRENNLYCEITTGNGIFSDNKAKRIESVASLLFETNPETTYKMAVVLAAARLEIMNIHYIDNYDELIEDETIDVLKIIAFSQDGQKTLLPISAELNQIGDLAITSSFENNIEINHVDAQKGIAVSEMAKKMDIDLDDVMTFGDNLNDLSMLKITGFSFAMENGAQETKNTAKYLTSANNENGVAEGIMLALNGRLEEKVSIN
ncbi:Cof-type HAD-IIB family hydrolase [Desemzia sp. FAM 23991]|uniref:Cof-type HAD-IIB family hydrolase n=1 Tax=unclassified Desemzia TaxID=2685243 RepID=UPI003885EEAE